MPNHVLIIISKLSRSSHFAALSPACEDSALISLWATRLITQHFPSLIHNPTHCTAVHSTPIQSVQAGRGGFLPNSQINVQSDFHDFFPWQPPGTAPTAHHNTTNPYWFDLISSVNPVLSCLCRRGKLSWTYGQLKKPNSPPCSLAFPLIDSIHSLIDIVRPKPRCIYSYLSEVSKRVIQKYCSKSAKITHYSTHHV